MLPACLPRRQVGSVIHEDDINDGDGQSTHMQIPEGTCDADGREDGGAHVDDDEWHFVRRDFQD